MNKLLFLLVGVVLFISCSTIKYVEPTTGERAKVRFATTASDYLVTVMNYRSRDCDGEAEWMKILNEDSLYLNNSSKTLGMPLWMYHKNAAKEVFVSGEEEKYFMFIGRKSEGNMIYSCAVPFSAKFTAGKQYELLFETPPLPLDFSKVFIKRTNNSQVCAVTVNELIKSGGNYERRKVNQFFNVQGEYGEKCVKAFKKVRWW